MLECIGDQTYKNIYKTINVAIRFFRQEAMSSVLEVMLESANDLGTSDDDDDDDFFEAGEQVRFFTV